MKALSTLFSFRGRINRKTFLIRFIALFAFPFVVKGMYPGAVENYDEPVVSVIQGVSIFGYIWCVWANSAKRWHDTNRSALYTFVMVIPIVGVLFNLLLNALMSGTAGPNRFGESPDARQSAGTAWTSADKCL
jgi:uncharacterized membrane protein YhaH (DUF805 family)